MKKYVRKKWVIVSLLILLLVAFGATYYTTVNAGYQSLEDMHGFPVPKSAMLESEEQNAKHYEWEGASAADGISKGYQFVIKNRGWKEADREGEVITYKKGKLKLQLHYDDNYIGILKEDV